VKTQFRLKDNILLVVYYLNDGDKIISQMRETFKATAWDEIIEIGVKKKKSKYLEYISIIKKLKKSRYENLFTGDFGQFSTILISNLNIDNIYAIDDGIGTLKWHEKELNPNLENNIKFSKKVKMLRYSFLGLKTLFDKKRINYFTMFNLKPYYGELIVKNKFLFMKEYFSNMEVDECTIFFLGQALLEDGWVSKKDYLMFLEYIKNYFKIKNITIFYIPHRRERNIKDLDYLIDEYFKIKNFSIPVELYLFNAEVLPNGVYSFMSTALYSIQEIFSINTTAFYIPQEYILANNNDIENRYSELRDNNVQILELKI